MDQQEPFLTDDKQGNSNTWVIFSFPGALLAGGRLSFTVKLRKLWTPETFLQYYWISITIKNFIEEMWKD